MAKEIAIPDLRAGFAYVMAATIAEGTSTITGLPYLDRGYERLVDKLAVLGAEVSRIQIDNAPEELERPLSSRQIRDMPFAVAKDSGNTCKLEG